MRRLGRWPRVAISVVALGVLLTFIPVRALLVAMGQVSLGVLAVTLAVFITGHVVAALKWRLLQGPQVAIPVVATLRAHFSGVLANLWLPGVVGGDLVRVGVVYRQSARPAAVALASLVDRVIDSVALVMLSFLGLAIIGAPAQDARRAFMVVAATGVVGVLGLAGAFLLLRSRLKEKHLAQIREAVALLAQRPGAVVGAFVLSACVQAAFILVNEQLGRAVGVDVATSVWFMAWPLSKLVALAPVSFAGIGIREAAIVMLMRPFTTSPDAVMASSLLWQGLLMVGGFIGWGVLTLVAAAPPPIARDALHSSRE